jgi:hypothetical protein
MDDFRTLLETYGNSPASKMPTRTLMATSPSKLLTKPCPIVAMPVTQQSAKPISPQLELNIPQRTIMQLNQSEGAIFFRTIFEGTSNKIYYR